MTRYSYTLVLWTGEPTVAEDFLRRLLSHYPDVKVGGGRVEEGLSLVDVTARRNLAADLNEAMCWTDRILAYSGGKDVSCPSFSSTELHWAHLE